MKRLMCILVFFGCVSPLFANTTLEFEAGHVRATYAIFFENGEFISGNNVSLYGWGEFTNFGQFSPFLLFHTGI